MRMAPRGKTPEFDPALLLQGLPWEVLRHILHFVCKGARSEEPLKHNHKNIDRVVQLVQSDVRTVGALRATNKGHPFRTYHSANRYIYYAMVLELWQVQDMATNRRALNVQKFSAIHATQLSTIYREKWVDQHRFSLAVKAAANEDPDALKRALQSLRSQLPL